MSGNELPKPINLSHPSWAGDDPRTRELRIRAAGEGYLYGSCFDTATEENAQFRPTVQLVEATAMRECACTGTDPAVRTRRRVPAERERAANSGPEIGPSTTYPNSKQLANIFPVTARPTQCLITYTFSELVIWSCQDIPS